MPNNCKINNFVESKIVMENYRVQAIMDDDRYGLSQNQYGDDRGQRFELMKNQKKSTIYPNQEIANLAIETHRRTRQDEKVQFYNLIKV